MLASEIPAIIPGAVITGPDRELVSITGDSRNITPGDTFIALKGSITDGHLFVQRAVESGAGVIIVNSAAKTESTAATKIEVPDTSDALDILLPALFPSAKKIPLTGITGTSGKTSITYLVEAILKASGANPGVIGTIETRYNEVHKTSSVTTPGPIELFETLENMARSGVDSCIMEVSSHALDQDRIRGLGFDYAVFTNLGQDHLDYHIDMDTYFTAKQKLFRNYLEGTAFINTDDPYGKRLIPGLASAQAYGYNDDCDIRIASVRNADRGLEVDLATPQGDIVIRSLLRGRIHASNIAASVGLGLAMGIPAETIREGIEGLEGIPGRMEFIENPLGFEIVVDYAHKPNALKMALTSARELAGERLITVFGCGGDRDRTKRPVMGRIAAELADIAIVTSDNPRTEDPVSIIEEIITGMGKGESTITEPDRKKAIQKAVSLMNPGDCLLIAGKGHETYQIIGETKYPFDDRKEVRAVLEMMKR